MTFPHSPLSCPHNPPVHPTQDSSPHGQHSWKPLGRGRPARVGQGIEISQDINPWWLQSFFPSRINYIISAGLLILQFISLPNLEYHLSDRILKTLAIMSTKTPVLTGNAPKPLPGIYSQAIVAGGFVYCSGAVAMDPETMKIIDGDVQAHTVSTFFAHNKRHVLTFCFSINASRTSQLFLRQPDQTSTKWSRSTSSFLT